MKKLTKLLILALLVAFLGACSGEGGSSGGTGEIVRNIPEQPRSVELCGTYPGTQKQGGATLTVDENCRFTYSSPDGNAEGRVVAVSENSTVYDGCFTSGQLAGECGRIRVASDGSVTLE